MLCIINAQINKHMLGFVTIWEFVLTNHFETLFLCKPVDTGDIVILNSYHVLYSSHTCVHTYSVLFCFSQHHESVSSSFSFLETFFLLTFFLWLYFCSVDRLVCVALYRLTVCFRCVFLPLYIAVHHLCVCVCVCVYLCVFVFTVLSLNFFFHYFLFYPVTLWQGFSQL